MSGEEQRLSRYRRMRDFARTPEPAGGANVQAELPRFVVQEHHATRLHWDFRLEHEGVLVSWAVPRGIPLDPARNHLAVHTEDHPLSYIDFAGEIPQGNYGAGQVYLWDQGTYECHKFKPDEVVVTLHGRRATGRYALFQTDGKNWMMHRMDPAPDLGVPLPNEIAPMKAKLASLPANDQDYAFEIKWDGIRAVAYIEHGRLRLESRRQREVTREYPELRAFGETLGARPAVLDGEIVAFDSEGRPSFERLQARMNLASDAQIRRIMRDVPVVYIVFDLLYLDGESLLERPYQERRARLESLHLHGRSWQTPAYHVGDGALMLAASREQGLEGIVAKRLDSRYEPGKRSGAWLKIKNQSRQEFVVGGYTPGERDEIGSLLVGYYAASGPASLQYAGGVGTGFTRATLDRLAAMLTRLRSDRNPFAVAPPKRPAIFVEPQLVCEVAFSGWTTGGVLRHPVFKGLRNDKDPREVVRERVNAEEA